MRTVGSVRCRWQQGWRGRFCHVDGVFTVHHSTFAKLVLFSVFFAVFLCGCIGVGVHRTFFPSPLFLKRKYLDKGTQTPRSSEDEQDGTDVDAPRITCGDVLLEDSGVKVEFDAVASEEYIRLASVTRASQSVLTVRSSKILETEV